MSSGVNLSEQACRLLRCPICKSALTLDDGSYVCERPTCGSVLPIVDGIPVLINESNSLFSVSDFTEKRNTTYASPTRTAIVGRFWSALFAMLPELGRNVRSAANYRRLAELLVLEHEKPLVLIVGGHVPG